MAGTIVDQIVSKTWVTAEHATYLVMSGFVSVNGAVKTEPRSVINFGDAIDASIMQWVA